MFCSDLRFLVWNVYYAPTNNQLLHLNAMELSFICTFKFGIVKINIVKSQLLD